LLVRSAAVNVIRLALKNVRSLVRLRRRYFGPHRPTWTEEFETLATVLRNGTNFSTLLPIETQRKLLEPKRPPTDVVRSSTATPARIAGVPSYWVERPESARDRVVVYLHGGGYSVGSFRSHTDLVARICKESGARTLVPEYRLAPEHPFPAQLEDSVKVYRHLLDTGFDPSRIVLAGDSAGGGLTVSTLLALRGAGVPMPAAAVLLSPWTDLEARGASVETNAEWDYITRRGLDVYVRRFVRRHDLRNPMAAPAYAELHGLPPLLIQVGEAEALRDDAVTLAERARAAGVAVELEIWPDMIHVFQAFASLSAEAREAVERVGAFCRLHVGAAPSEGDPTARTSA
jgi:epsilon-lactone hydrolase